MKLNNWLNRLVQRNRRSRKKAPHHPTRRAQALFLEVLEDRTLPTTTVFLDFGLGLPGSLKTTVAELRATIERQQAQIDKLSRLSFGRKSERAAGPTLFDQAPDSWQDIGPLSGIKEPSKTRMGYLSGPGGRAVIYVDGHVEWQDN